MSERERKPYDTIEKKYTRDLVNRKIERKKTNRT